MKHTLKITILLICMFIAAQLIGLYVVNFYANPSGVNQITGEQNQIPYGFGEQQKEMSKNPNFYQQFLVSFIISFIIAVIVVFLMMKIKSTIIFRIWFFTVVTIALGIFFNIFTTKLNLQYASLIALLIGLIFAYFKVFRRNIIIHNITELWIYPGIAAIFVVMLNLTTTIILLVLISIYDIWAVWHSGIMQKMAKFQINSLGIMGGFLIPYANKKIREKIKLLKIKYKKQGEIPNSVIKRNKIKVNLAILGGGDIVFPIIATGVFFKTFGNIYSALCVTLFASLALLYLFFIAKKKKFYPAMPYLTTGIFIGMLIGYLINLL